MVVCLSMDEPGRILCGACSYDLRGLEASGRCPACGYSIQESIALAGRKRRKPLRRFWLVISALLSTCSAGSLIWFHLWLRKVGLQHVPLNGYGMTSSDVRFGLEILRIAGALGFYGFMFSAALIVAAAVKRDSRGVVIALLLAVAAACCSLRSASWGLVLAGV
jgi:hypothetical protein